MMKHTFSGEIDSVGVVSIGALSCSHIVGDQFHLRRATFGAI
jgi:hypothetical protein